jgi:hypothetical protein
MSSATRARSLLVAVAAAVVAAVVAIGVVLVAPSASASPLPGDRAAARGCHTPRCFGAISFNKRTGIAGLSNDRDGRHKAIRLAQRNCRAKSERQFGSPGQCTAAGSVQNGCMAVAFRVQDDVIVEWTTKFGHTRREAKSAAHAAVAGPGDRYFAAWLCTTRSY